MVSQPLDQSIAQLLSRISNYRDRDFDAGRMSLQPQEALSALERACTATQSKSFSGSNNSARSSTERFVMWHSLTVCLKVRRGT